MTTAPGIVLILGADGFIGRHLACGLRASGWQVIADWIFTTPAGLIQPLTGLWLLVAKPAFW